MAATTVVASAYSTAGGNGGRQITGPLLNGWLISVVANGNTDIRFYKSSDGGATWSFLTTHTPAIASTPSISILGTAASNNVHFIFQGSNTKTSFARFDASTIGSTLSVSVIDSALTFQPSGSSVSIAMASNGDLTAVWSGKISTYPNSYNIRSAKSTDGGTTWTKQNGTAGIDQITAVNSSGVNYTNPCVVVTSSGLAIFLEYTSGITSIVNFLYAGSWGSSHTLYSTLKSQSTPTALVKNNGSNIGRIWVAWHGTDSTDTTKQNLRVNYSDDSGTTWGTEIKITSGNSVDRKLPTLAENSNGDIFVFYQDDTGISYQTCLSAGNTFYGATTFESAGTNPAVLMNEDSGNIDAIYMASSQVKFDSVSATIALDGTPITAAYDTSGNGGRKIVRLSNGWLVVAAYSGTTIYVYKSTDNGATWTQLCYASSSSSTSFALSAYGTMVYLLRAYSGGTMVFYPFDATTVTNTSLNSGTQYQPDTSQTAFGSVSMSVDSTGNIAIAYASKNSTYPNSFNIRSAKSVDGGVTWTKQDGTAGVDQVSGRNTAGNDVTNPCIVIRSGLPHIIAQYVNGTTHAIADFTTAYTSVIYGGGDAAWGNTNIYQVVTYVQANPCAAVAPNGRIWVAWHGVDSTDSIYANIRYSYSDDGGTTWLTAVKLTSGNVYNQEVATVSIDKNNNAYVLWIAQDAASSSHYNVFRNIWTGSAFQGVTKLTTNTTGNAVNPASIDNNTLNFALSTPPTIYQDAQHGVDMYIGTIKLVPSIFCNIGGVWKSADSFSINIGGVWKDVDSLSSNIGGTWRDS